MTFAIVSGVVAFFVVAVVLSRQTSKIKKQAIADLEAEKTISYELGFNQAITSDFSAGVSLYQRDIRGLISADRIVETYSPGVLYAQYTNRDISEIRACFTCRV